MLIAAAAQLGRARHPDPRRADQPSRYRQHQHARTLADVEFKVPMLIVSHDREILDRVTERTIFLRRDGVHAFKAPFSLAREELLRQDAARGSAASWKRRKSSGWRRWRRATRRGRSKIPNSTSARTPSRSASPASRPSARRPTSHASAAGAQRRRDRRQGGAAACQISTSRRRTARELDRHRAADRSPPASASRCWAPMAPARRRC